MLLIYGVLCVSVVVLQKMDQKSNTFASINDSEMASMRNMCELISASINSGNVLSVFMIFEEWSKSLAKLSKSSVRKNLSLGKPTKPTINFPPSLHFTGLLILLLIKSQSATLSPFTSQSLVKFKNTLSLQSFSPRSLPCCCLTCMWQVVSFC